MTPLTVFVRTLMKTSAIFIGVTAVMLHPSLSGRPRRAASPRSRAPPKAAVDGLIAALKDSDAGVRRQAAATLGQLGNCARVPGLIDALKDTDADVRAARDRRAR